MWRHVRAELEHDLRARRERHGGWRAVEALAADVGAHRRGRVEREQSSHAEAAAPDAEEIADAELRPAGDLDDTGRREPHRADAAAARRRSPRDDDHAGRRTARRTRNVLLAGPQVRGRPAPRRARQRPAGSAGRGRSGGTTDGSPRRDAAASRITYVLTGSSKSGRKLSAAAAIPQTSARMARRAPVMVAPRRRRRARTRAARRC